MTGSNEMKEQTQEEEILNAINIAKYFSILVDREAGDLMTAKKLHKLMYLAQGIHLALYDKPLFKEEIEASEDGPVVKELDLLQQLSCYSKNIIKLVNHTS